MPSSDHRLYPWAVQGSLSPLTITEEDVDWFATALDQVVGEAQKMGRAMTSFAIRAARAGRGGKNAATAR